MCVALAYVLSFLVFWQQPAGGQVSLEPIPILVLALWRGVGVGTLAGAIEGLLHFVREPFLVHPASLLLDYPLAGAALGLAGLAYAAPRGWFESRGATGPVDAMPRWLAAVAVALATLAAYTMHVVSGYLFWSQGVRGIAAWTGSLVYNAGYMGPQLLVNMLVAPLLSSRRLVLS
jgi:thiamine transporter